MAQKFAKLSTSGKSSNLKEIFNHISITVKYELFDKSQIKNFDKEDYELDLESNESESNENIDEEDWENMDVEL